MTTLDDILRYMTDSAAECGPVEHAWCEPSKHGEPGVLLCMLRVNYGDGLRYVKDWLVVEDPEMGP